MTGSDGAVWVMRARSARWFLWRLRGMITEPSSRFFAVIEKRRKDQADAAAQLTGPQPGDEDY